MKSVMRKAVKCLFLAFGMLVFAACTFVLPEAEQVQPESEQVRPACPLPAGVAPPADPPVTAQQVEDGNASLTDFALAAFSMKQAH